MSKIVPIKPRGRRLKSLDEFEAPDFVGRMARVQRRQKFEWWAIIVLAVSLGTAIGLTMF